MRLAREERRPTLIEAFTYRYRGHSAADPEVYREREEVEEWREKDPIESFARRCIEAGVLGERELAEVREKAEQAVLAAVEFAEASPEPALDTLYEKLYVLDRGRLVRGRRAQPRAAPRRARGKHAGGGAGAGRSRRRLRRTRRRGPRPNPATHGDAQEGVEPGSPKRSRRAGRRLMAELRMREALRDAMAEEMRRDEAVW